MRLKVTKAGKPLMTHNTALLALRGFAATGVSNAQQIVQDEITRLEALSSTARTLPYGTPAAAVMTYTTGQLFVAMKNQIRLTNSELNYAVNVTTGGSVTFIASITVSHKYVLTASATTYTMTFSISSIPEVDNSVSTDVTTIRNRLNVQTYSSTNGFLKSTFSQATLDARPSVGESDLNVAAISVLLGLNVTMPKNPQMLHDARYAYNHTTKVLTIALY